MVKSTFDKLMPYIVLIIILTGLTEGGIYLYQQFTSDGSEHKITFEVVGVTGSLNATTLVSLHFECIKYCEEVNSDDYGDSKCWEQCSKLGKEECSNED